MCSYNDKCMYFKVVMNENKICAIFSDSRQKIDMTVFMQYALYYIDRMLMYIFHTLKLSQREVL